MIRTIVNSPLLAFYDYNEQEQRLFVYLRSGLKVLIDKFNKSAYRRLCRERNKGSYMFHHVFNNPVYDKWNMGKISPKRIERIIIEETNQRPQVYRWLAS